MNKIKQKLSLGEKFGYGFGDLASNLFWMTFMLYFTYFYTDVFLIPAYVAATMFLMSRLWDGVNDPLMGIISDRTNTRWGKFRPYLLWICVPFAIIGVLTFTVPDLGMTGKIVWAYVTFILIMMLYTAINIPYTSLLGVISPDSAERTSVSSIKFVFAFAGGIIVSATLLPMTKQLGKNDSTLIQASVSNTELTVKEQKKGNARLVVIAEDSKGNKEQTDFSFRIDPKENNLPKLKKKISDIEVIKGFSDKEIPFEDVFTGTEPEIFTFKVESADEGVVTAELLNGKIVIKEKGSGSSKITFSAKDKKWGETTTEFYAFVNETGNNKPQVIDSINSFVLNVGFETFNLDLSTLINDPDGDEITFTVESDNEKVFTPSLEGSTITAIEGNKGLANVNVIAKDNRGGFLSHSFKVIVKYENDNPPFLNAALSDVIEEVGFSEKTIDISKVFIDVDGEPIEYKVQVINEAKGWQRTFMIFGAAAILFFLIAFKYTRERVTPSKEQTTSVGKDLLNLVTNKPWVLLLATTITFILFVAIRGSVTVHYFKYVIGNQDLKLPFFGERTFDFIALASAYNTIGQISSLIGALLVAVFAKLIGKKKAFVTLFIIAIISTGSVFFLTAENLGLIFFLQITGSITGGPLSVLIWAMYADTADYSEWKNGTRSTGLIFSASTMSQKFGWAFGAFLALNLMAQLGFQPNVQQSAESLRGLLLLFTIIPAGLGLLSIFISLFYPLNDKKVKEITDELNLRREKEELAIS
ncbi:MAG: MFS transporter [Bacteroidales bacterium]|nr:MFS transporter [Bacteroidales bacterium]MBN2819267.1 MFS transporter [Bacteroidales bacterium]